MVAGGEGGSGGRGGHCGGLFGGTEEFGGVSWSLNFGLTGLTIGLSLMVTLTVFV